ncbi:MAG: hypothetical protein E7185_02575 [Erysipelotrichaceae bacterium]|nr:hypothetical protein [Erysipelotrichaceae bacterium]
MTETRTNRKQNEEEYAEYSQAVQRYHRYDEYIDDLSKKKETDERYIAEAKKKQLIILAGMNEDEYRELQKSLKNHIVQKRIHLDQQHKELMKLTEKSPDGKIYTYCVESVDDDLCSPLAVFSSTDLDEARRYASEAYENRTDDYTIQISEGLFDSDGNMLGNTMTAFVLDSWAD